MDTQERLEKATALLEAEQQLWIDNQIAPNSWRMNDSEFYMVCQMIAMYRLMKDVLGIEEDMFTAVLREVTTEELGKLRDQILTLKRNELMSKLTEGIQFTPPPDILGRNGQA
jgi:hypothetical protein